MVSLNSDLLRYSDQRIVCDEIAVQSSILFFISVPGKYHSRHLQLMGKVMLFKVKGSMILHGFCPVSGGSIPGCLLALVLFALNQMLVSLLQ